MRQLYRAWHSHGSSTCIQAVLEHLLQSIYRPLYDLAGSNAIHDALVQTRDPGGRHCRAYASDCHSASATDSSAYQSRYEQAKAGFPRSGTAVPFLAFRNVNTSNDEGWPCPRSLSSRNLLTPSAPYAGHAPILNARRVTMPHAAIRQMHLSGVPQSASPTGPAPTGCRLQFRATPARRAATTTVAATKRQPEAAVQTGRTNDCYAPLKSCLWAS